MFIDGIAAVKVIAVKNVFRIFSAVGRTATFLKNLATSPFSMYRF